MEKDYAENLDLMDKVDSEKVQIFLNVQPECKFRFVGTCLPLKTVHLC